MDVHTPVVRTLKATGFAGFLLLAATKAYAVEAPLISADGATISWPAIDAITINVHDAADGSWLDSISGSETSWEALYPGSFFMVGADHGEWQNWGKSNVVMVDFQEPIEPDIDLTLTNVRGTVYSSTALELFWDVPADQNVARVEIIRFDGVEPATFTDGRSFFEQGLLPNTTYDYSLEPYDADGNTGEISYISLTTTAGLAAQDDSNDEPVAETIFTNGINQMINDPTPDSLIGLAAVVYSDSALELIWPRTDDSINDLHHVVYQNGRQIATSTGYSHFIDGLQAGTIYAFEVRRVTLDGSVQDAYRNEARTRGTLPNISPLSVNASVLYEAIAPTAIAQIDGDFERVKTWLTQTHDLPGFDRPDPEQQVEFIGTYNCPLAGTVSVEQYVGVYDDKDYYTFDQCQFPQTVSEPNRFSNETLYTFSTLNGRLERDEFDFSDSGSSSRIAKFNTEGFTATRHNGSIVSMQGNTTEGYSQAAIKASSLPNGDAVITKTSEYNLLTFSDSAIASGTRFDSISTTVMSTETNEGINYKMVQTVPVTINNTRRSTSFTLVEPIVFDISANNASANISLSADNLVAVSFFSNGSLRAPVTKSTLFTDGSTSTDDIAFHEESHLPRDLMTQLCVWQRCNFADR